MSVVELLPSIQSLPLAEKERTASYRMSLPTGGVTYHLCLPVFRPRRTVARRRGRNWKSLVENLDSIRWTKFGGVSVNMAVALFDAKAQSERRRKGSLVWASDGNRPCADCYADQTAHRRDNQRRHEHRFDKEHCIRIDIIGPRAWKKRNVSELSKPIADDTRRGEGDPG